MPLSLDFRKVFNECKKYLDAKYRADLSIYLSNDKGTNLAKYSRRFKTCIIVLTRI